MSDPTTSPLLAASAISLDALFDADPLDLDDPAYESLVLEMRRRRSVWAGEEAAKLAKGKAARAPKPHTTQATAVAASKPITEMSLDELEG